MCTVFHILFGHCSQFSFFTQGQTVRTVCMNRFCIGQTDKESRPCFVHAVQKAAGRHRVLRRRRQALLPKRKSPPTAACVQVESNFHGRHDEPATYGRAWGQCRRYAADDTPRADALRAAHSLRTVRRRRCAACGRIARRQKAGPDSPPRRFEPGSRRGRHAIPQADAPLAPLPAPACICRRNMIE